MSRLNRWVVSKVFNTDIKALWADDFFARIDERKRRCHEEKMIYNEKMGAWLMIFSCSNYWNTANTYWICLYDQYALLPVPETVNNQTDELIEEFREEMGLPEIVVHSLSSPALMLHSVDEFVLQRLMLLDRKDWLIRFVSCLQLPWWSFTTSMLFISLTWIVCMRNTLVFSSFNLFGLFFDNQAAAVLFAAWSIPMLALNSFLHREERDVINLIALGLLPVSLRVITLFQNTQPRNTWIAYGIIGIATITEGLSCVFAGHNIMHTLECMRNTAAKIATMIAFLFLLLQTVLPSFGWVLSSAR